jgi:hypothetical protein
MSSRTTALTLAAMALAGSAQLLAQDQAPATGPSGIFIEVTGQPPTRLPSATSQDMQTKGIAKMMLTQGLSKPKFVVTHPGATASVSIEDSRPSFILRFGPKADRRAAMDPSAMGDQDSIPPLTDNPKDFTLARMTVADGARSIDTGKIDRWTFDVREVKPREYRLTLKAPLAPGEYAFFYSKGGNPPAQIWAFAVKPAADR